VSFAAFEAEAPDFAAAARRLFSPAPTASRSASSRRWARGGGPRSSPQKIGQTGAFLGKNDEELQLAGRASGVLDAGERARVHAAIPFAAFGRSDPIFRLGIERALWVFWERVGQPDTRPVRRRWSRA
jgi:hypothetical protein